MKREVPVGGIVKPVLIQHPKSVPIDMFMSQLAQHALVSSFTTGIDLAGEGSLARIEEVIAAEEAYRGCPNEELRAFLFVARMPFDVVFLVSSEEMPQDELQEILRDVCEEFVAYIPNPAWALEIANLIEAGDHYEVAAIGAALALNGSESDFALALPAEDGESVIMEIGGQPLLSRLLAIGEEMGMDVSVQLMFARLAAEAANIRAVDWQAERLEGGSADMSPLHESAGFARGTDLTTSTQ